MKYYGIGLRIRSPHRVIYQDVSNFPPQSHHEIYGWPFFVPYQNIQIEKWQKTHK